MNKNVLIAIVSGVVGATASIVAPVAIVQHNGTIRETTCVENGGAYVLTEAGTGRECRR